MSYDIDTGFHWMKEEMSQSLWNRAVSYDHKIIHSGGAEGSQSLWNRAVSYDLYVYLLWRIHYVCLNPFGTGQCLTTFMFIYYGEFIMFVSIPLEQGSVLRRLVTHLMHSRNLVSIPLEQGSVLRRSVYSCW